MSTYVFKDRKGETVKLKYNPNDLQGAVLNIVKAIAPHRTGDLKNRIRIEQNQNGFTLISDIEYMPFTTETWGFNRRWNKTLKNPNEAWWDNAFEIVRQFITQVYGKEIKHVG